LRRAAQREARVALDDDQAHRPVADELQDQAAVELERGGEQRGGAGELDRRARARAPAGNRATRAAYATCP
jgi:hypothetical protein